MLLGENYHQVKVKQIHSPDFDRMLSSPQVQAKACCLDRHAPINRHPVQVGQPWLVSVVLLSLAARCVSAYAGQ